MFNETGDGLQNLHFGLQRHDVERLHKVLQRGQILLRVCAQMTRMNRLLPLLALDGLAAAPPELHHLLQALVIAQCIVLRVEEKSRRRHRSVPENIDR